jgi:[ribosomal protein S5]-alanine N-acetyltransferase
MRLKPRWPATLCEPDLLSKPVVLHRNRIRDARKWSEIRLRNAQWLRPWEMEDPESPHYHCSRKSYLTALAAMRCETLLGRALPWAISFGDELVGEVWIGRIAWGPERSGCMGAWIDEGFARRGIMTIALAMAIDHGFRDIGLHRLEGNIRPENTASLQGVEKLGFHYEGRRVRQAFVDGAWRDHLCYAITAEDVPDGLVAGLRRAAMPSSDRRDVRGDRGSAPVT